MSKSRWLVLSFFIAISLGGCTYYNIEKMQLEKKTNKIEIEFWYGLSGYSNQLMKEYIDEFNNSQNDYYVVGVEQSSYEETFKALKSSIARKRVPSVVLLENQHLFYLASKGVIFTLNDFADDKQLDDFIESYLEQNKIRDDIMGIPMYGTTSVLFYRRDFFKQHNIKPVDLLTWEAVSEVASKLTQKNNEETLVYGWEIMYGAQNLIDAAISNGGNFLSDDGKQIMINSEEWVEAWEFFRELIHDKNVMKVHYGVDSWSYLYATIDDLMQGRAAGYIGSCGDRGELDSRVIGTYMLPSWENKLANPRGVVNLYSLCIPLYVEQDKKDGALEWITYLTNEEKSLHWVTNTGFLPVRKSSMDEDAFYDVVLENPDYFIPISQVKLGTKIFIDSTDGKIYDLLETAANKVLIENVPAMEALTEAQIEAQYILDSMLNQGR
ncbi:MAG: ABC transporter substrate-binding protein [Firmicutes bacterium HGW-Firmicutes-7]|nr:MAG: ABC transporter substrate-binding protein [Firmicutes bacterium HGW-Firmicutes-7]